MNTLPEALADVTHTFRHLEFAIRLMCYCEQGRLDLANFDSDLSLLLTHENVGFEAGRFATLESIIPPAQALVSVAFGASAMVLNAAFDVAGGARKPTSRLPEDELRTLVYMVRCAFAHNPAFPLWKARGKEFVRQLSLPLDSGSLTVDLRLLNGKPFEYEHIGGFANWLKIRAACEVLLK